MFSKKKRRPSRAKRRLRFEALEDRQVLSAMVTIENVAGIGAVLKVRGDAGAVVANDIIYVNVRQSGVEVVDATTSRTTPVQHSLFKEIHVAGNNGNDFVRVSVDSNVPQAILGKPIKVWGGNGNDTITVDARANLASPSSPSWSSAPETAIEVSGDAGTDRVNVEQWMPKSMWGVEQVAIADRALQMAQQELRTYSAAASGWYHLNVSLFKRLPITSAVGMRNPELYRRVIEQFDVQFSHAKRYRPDSQTTVDTRCNIFAGDVMRAMNVPLPTKSGGINDLTKNAKDLNSWFKSSAGASAGWREIVIDSDAKMAQLVNHLKAGKPAVASRSDHIAVLRPDQDTAPTKANLPNLLIAQAGAANYNRARISDVSGWRQNNYQGVQFFVHD
ncbi:MAG: hypothetical protein J5I93_03785 [Pirellulaceae bacterium]|nr:hypothetical protein [Pirellulaceae bacterium]